MGKLARCSVVYSLAFFIIVPAGLAYLFGGARQAFWENDYYAFCVLKDGVLPENTPLGQPRQKISRIL